MIYSETINLTLKFIYKAHAGALDKGRVPYVFHPLAVAEQMETEEEVLTALLHDVVEDTDYTFEDIKLLLGVSDKVIEALKLLTHSDEDDYDEYIDKIMTNDLARRVKIADVTHNMTKNRIDYLTEKDEERLERYKGVLKRLTSV